LKQISRHFTYANVMSSIAVFLMLGGATAFAASKIGPNQLKANSVKTGKIVKEAVTTSKLKNGAVGETKIAKDAVTGEKVKDGSLTGSDINASTLGTVPNAEKLGGTPASGYAKSQLPDPTIPTLVGTWKTEPGRAPASFYKDSFGIVHLEGVVEGGGTFSEIFSLPSGFRPSQSANFLVYGNASTPAGIFIDDEDGEVALLGGDDAFISLYGITFRAGK
jgi:hypothetical protein